MNPTQPSFLVVALLRIVESENEPLAGDLLEEWRAGRPRRWLWTQLLRAVVTTLWQKRAGSAQLLRSVPSGLPGRQGQLLDPATLNLRGPRVASVGGAGLLGIVMVITVVLPQAWFLVFAGVAGGVLIGVATILLRRSRGLSGPDDSRPLSLFGAVELTDLETRPQVARNGLIRLVAAWSD